MSIHTNFVYTVYICCPLLQKQNYSVVTLVAPNFFFRQVLCIASKVSTVLVIITCGKIKFTLTLVIGVTKSDTLLLPVLVSKALV